MLFWKNAIKCAYNGLEFSKPGKPSSFKMYLSRKFPICLQIFPIFLERGGLSFELPCTWHNALEVTVRECAFILCWIQESEQSDSNRHYILNSVMWIFWGELVIEPVVWYHFCVKCKSIYTWRQSDANALPLNDVFSSHHP